MGMPVPKPTVYFVTKNVLPMPKPTVQPQKQVPFGFPEGGYFYRQQALYSNTSSPGQVDRSLE